MNKTIVARGISLLVAITFVVAPVVQVAAQGVGPGSEPIVEENGSGTNTNENSEPYQEPSQPQGSGASGPIEDPSLPQGSGAGGSDPTEPEVPDTEPSTETPEEPTEPEAASQANPADDERATIGSATKDRSISSPKVDKSSGALVQSYPFTLPQGINGLTPDLSLYYSSNATDNSSIVGYGWSVSIPSIERINKLGVENLYSKDYYAASDAGELASSSPTNTLTQGSYVAKNSRGEVVTYVFDNNIWTVQTKDGTTYKYGATDASRLSNSDGTKVAAWYLSDVTDANGNTITYTYEKDANKVYPKTIQYSGLYAVEFGRESRTDAMTSYATGFSVKTNSRINKVSVKVDGVTRREYALGYSSGVNGARSLLSTITEKGISSTGVETTMPPTTFEYENSPITFVKDDKYGSERITNAAFTADFDANGIMDALWQGKTIFSFPKRITTENQNFGFWGIYGYYRHDDCQPGNNDCPPLFSRAVGQRLLDVNNDQKVDWIIGRRYFKGQITNPNPPETLEYRLYLNMANGTCCMHYPTVYSTPPTKTFESAERHTDYFNTQHILANLNGDPFLETISREFSVSRGTTLPEIWGNFDEGKQYILPPVFIKNDTNYPLPNQGVDLVTPDLNGDGLDDLIASSTLQHLNGGDPSLGSAVWIETASYTKSDDKKFVPVDVNGDGLVDFAKTDGNNIEIYINKGTGLSAISTLQVGCSAESECSSVLVDMNGDGMVDSLPYLNQAKRPDMLKKISYPMGGTSAIEYEPTPQHIDANNEQVHPKLPSILYTVKKITSDPGFGQVVNTVTYTYKGGKNYDDPNDVFKHRFAGFETITEKQSDGSYSITYYHQGDGVNTATGEPEDSFALIGLPYREELYESYDQLASRSVSTYTTVNRGNDVYSVYPKDVINTEFGSGTSKRSKAQTSTFNTTTGLLTQSITWGEVTESASANGTFTDSATDSLTKNLSYATSTDGKILAVAQEELIGATGTLAAKTKYTYDLLPFGQVVKGNGTKVEQQKDTSGAFIQSSKTYNSFGQVLTETDPNNHTTTYEYASDNLYVQKVINALNQATNYSNYDYMCSKALHKQNPNGSTAYSKLDGFCRTLESGSTDASGNEVMKASYTYTDTSLGVNVEEKTWLTPTHSVSTFTYVDGFGRTLQTKRQAEDGKWVTADTIYDANGRVFKSSLPYFTNSSSKEAATINPALYVEYTYDSLNRTIRVKNVLGSTLRDYKTDVWSVTTTDANNKKKTLESDAYGRLVKVIENNKGSQYVTTYKWDDLGKLKLITDALNNTRWFDYDMLGRQTIAGELQSGQWNFGRGYYFYHYDDVGNLTMKSTPAGPVIEYTYDDLNRILTETTHAYGYDTQTTTYTYDTCQYSAGTRNACTVTKNIGAANTYSEKNYYYKDGSLKVQVKKIDGESFTTKYTYNSIGKVVTLTNADGAVTSYTYGAGGQMDSITYKPTPAGAAQTIATNINYAPTGAMSLIEYGNNTKTINGYDENKLYRLTLRRTVANTLLPASLPIASSSPMAAATPISSGIQVDYKPTPLFNLNHLPSVFSAVYYDQNSSATTTANWYQVQISDDSTFATSSMIWDSGKKESMFGPRNQGEYVYMAYTGGNILPVNTEVNIRVRFWNQFGDVGMWSSGNDLMSFTPQYHDIQSIEYTYDAVGNIKQTRKIDPQGGVQQLVEEYTYDDLYRLVKAERFLPGNVWTTINSQTWTYDAINNILTEESKLNFGATVKNKTYEYNTVPTLTPIVPTSCGSTDERNCINPHSPVKITTIETNNSGPTPVTTTLVTNMWYDKNGNTVLTQSSDGSSTKYAWTPTEELASVIDTTSSARYLYDPSGTRIQTKSTNPTNHTAITTFPSRFLNVTRDQANTLGTTTSHIFMGSTMVASYAKPVKAQKADINGDSAVDFNDLVILSQNYNTDGIGANEGDITLDGMVDFNDLVVLSQSYNTSVPPVDATLLTYSYIHTDHLGGSNVITDKNGNVRQYMDYVPFGEPFLDINYDGKAKEQRTFTGHEYDVDTQLTYMGARYYNAKTGQFLSVDPNFFSELNLSDPQSFNSYAYARNNPIVYIDPDGRNIVTAGLGALFGAVFGGSFGGTYAGLTGGSIWKGVGYGIAAGATGGFIAGGSYGLTSSAGVSAAVSIYTAGVYGGVTSGVTTRAISGQGFNNTFNFNSISKDAAVGGFSSIATYGAFSGISSAISSFRGGVSQSTPQLALPAGGGSASTEVSSASRYSQIDFISDVTVINRGTKVVGQGTLDARQILNNLDDGVYSTRGAYRNDQGFLPQLPQGQGYEHFGVPTPGLGGAGPQRLYTDPSGNAYYAPNHLDDGLYYQIRFLNQ
jgi:RHS repeat-associated protein